MRGKFRSPSKCVTKDLFFSGMIFRVFAIKKPYFSLSETLKACEKIYKKSLKNEKSLFYSRIAWCNECTMVKFQMLWLKECFDLPLFCKKKTTQKPLSPLWLGNEEFNSPPNCPCPCKSRSLSCHGEFYGRPHRYIEFWITVRIYI